MILRFKHNNWKFSAKSIQTTLKQREYLIFGQLVILHWKLGYSACWVICVSVPCANCLSFCPQESRAVLAQWPLKSVRYYESSGQGQFTIETGTVAPMGDGVYNFHTLPGSDNRLYDAVDHFVINTLDRVKVRAFRLLVHLSFLCSLSLSRSPLPWINFAW